MDYGHYGHTRAGTLTHRLLSLEMELIEEREKKDNIILSAPAESMHEHCTLCSAV